jgi:hypothetical protein
MRHREMHWVVQVSNEIRKHDVNIRGIQKRALIIEHLPEFKQSQLFISDYRNHMGTELQ